MLGERLHGSDLRERCWAIEPFRQHKVSQCGSPLGHRACLVEGDHINGIKLLQGVTFTEQDTHFRSTSRPDHDRGRRRKPHRAGARDDEHRHTGDQRHRQGRIRPEKQPDQHGRRRDRHHGRHEPQGDPVDQSLDRQFGALGLFDHANNLRQGRVGADPRGEELQASGAVDRPAGHRISGTFFSGDRLACQHAFVDAAGPLDDLAIDRDAFTRAHDDDVTLNQRIDLDLDAFSVPHHACSPRLKP